MTVQLIPLTRKASCLLNPIIWRCPIIKLLENAQSSTSIPTHSLTEGSNSPVSKGESYASIYEINELRCIFCGYCEEACPVGAIVLSNEYEFCADDRNKFLYEKEDFLVDRNEDYPELKNRYPEEKLLTYL